MSEVISVSASADGKSNGYLFACDVVGQRRSYSVCLSLIGRKDDSRIGVIYADCIGSIKKGTCPALKMRKEEEKAGHAIYFVDRSVDIVIPEYKKRRTRISEQPVESAVVPARSGDLISRIGDMNYAKAVNDEIKKTAAPAPKEKVETVIVEKKTAPKVEAIPGESLLDMAKRILAQQS